MAATRAAVSAQCLLSVLPTLARLLQTAVSEFEKQEGEKTLREDKDIRQTLAGRQRFDYSQRQRSFGSRLLACDAL
jgi:hypothetical protein